MIVLARFMRSATLALVLLGGVVAVVCQTNPAFARSIVSEEQEARIIEALRPTVLALGDIGSHSLAGPVISVFFFITILNYSKHLE